MHFAAPHYSFVPVLRWFANKFCGGVREREFVVLLLQISNIRKKNMQRKVDSIQLLPGRFATAE